MANQARDQPNRDIEKVYSVSEFVAKLRRLADAPRIGESLRNQGRRRTTLIPAKASFSIEHERTAAGDELVFQLRW